MTGHGRDPGGPDDDAALRAMLSASVSDVRMPADLLVVRRLRNETLVGPLAQ